MKMKEVLAQTGLTDRAVRLYIDNGLIAPDIEENYSGRKNIEFSQSDIDRLKNIALLRKIGFSIPDIKEISQGGENTKSIIEAFIQQKRENIESDTLVLEQLKNIPLDTKITMESLCLQLSSAAENKQVPKEDLQLMWVDKLEKRGIDFWGFINLVSALAAMFFFAVGYCKSYVHFNFFGEYASLGFAHIFGSWGIVILLSTFLLLLNRKNAGFRKKKSLRRYAYGFFALMLVPCWLGAFGVCVLSSALGESYTNDVSDYLVLDSWVEDNYGTEIKRIFPDEIPASALDEDGKNPYHIPYTTRYYYFHDYPLDPRFDIAAQWILPENEYESAKSEMFELNLNNVRAIKGDWVCYYLADDDKKEQAEYWDDKSYWFLIFACNDKTNTVRYIASYCVDSSRDGPYYLSMDW
ncbi:MAG: MerR family transcriptional regulator [Clostridia bacterium]|nr:MerR family transcriptional regulator [Clostridia bacterium]